jgi:putative hydrolase of the HAD superfamily
MSHWQHSRQRVSRLDGSFRWKYSPPSNIERINAFGECGERVRAYKAVIFDMFDTLVNFRNVHLPLIQVNGREVRSTSPFVYEVLKPLCATVPFEEFFLAFLGTYRAAEEIRTVEQREVTLRERFGMLFDRLQISEGPDVATLMEAGIAAHTRQLILAMEFPDSHRALLDRLQSQYRLGIISNFDHAATVEMALTMHNIRDRFEAVVVSADVGWRKPHAEIFLEAFRQMGIGPTEAIFVGDTPEVDVLGAQGVGMDVIWIDDGTKILPPGSIPPTHTVANFVAVERLL